MKKPPPPKSAPPLPPATASPDSLMTPWLPTSSRCIYTNHPRSGPGVRPRRGERWSTYGTENKCTVSVSASVSTNPPQVLKLKLKLKLMAKKTELQRQVMDAIAAAEEKKADDVTVLELDKTAGGFTDYFF